MTANKEFYQKDKIIRVAWLSVWFLKSRVQERLSGVEVYCRGDPVNLLDTVLEGYQYPTEFMGRLKDPDLEGDWIQANSKDLGRRTI